MAKGGTCHSELNRVVKYIFHTWIKIVALNLKIRYYLEKTRVRMTERNKLHKEKPTQDTDFCSSTDNKEIPVTSCNTSHNKLPTQNWIWDTTDFLFINWQQRDLNNPYHNITVIIYHATIVMCEVNLSEKHSLQFFSTYFQYISR